MSTFTPPRLTRALWLALEKRAAADGMTPDEAIVQAVERYVSERRRPAQTATPGEEARP